MAQEITPASKRRALIKIEEAYKFTRIAALDLKKMGFEKESTILATMALGIINLSKQFPES